MGGRLNVLMNQVFTPSGEVRQCRKELRSDLIRECNIFYPDTNFGDPDEGILEIETILDLRSRMVKSTLEELYDRVFDKHGNVKACGRQVCAALIAQCSMYRPDINFGNFTNGSMNIEEIKKLRDKLVCCG